MFNTPILFLVFNRPDLTRKVFERIRMIKPGFLYVAADGPRSGNEEDTRKCSEVRDFIEHSIDWPCEFKTLYRDENLGCGNAVSGAINWFFDQVEKGIILEDDVLPELSFFHFCQHCLEKYQEDERIVSIKGTHLIKEVPKSSYFYSSFGGIWGWATWKRSWKHYSLNPKYENEVFDNHFQDKRVSDFYKNFYQSGQVKVDTWDHQWIYTIYKLGGLTIEPSVNLITNLGFREDATHTTKGEFNFESEELGFPLKSPKKVEANQQLDYLYFNRLKLGSRKENGGLIVKLFLSLYNKIRRVIKYKLISDIYVFGDSHAQVFEFINRQVFNVRFNVNWIGGATAVGLRNPNSKTNALKEFESTLDGIKNKRTRLVFLLGEVDTGFVIWYRARKYNEDIEKQLQESISAYFAFIKRIKEKGFKNIYIVSAPLPTIRDNQDIGEVANLRKDVQVSQLKRTELTLTYNKKLKTQCAKLGIHFVDLDNFLLNKERKSIKDEFLNEDISNHHLDNKKYSRVIIKGLRMVGVNAFYSYKITADWLQKLLMFQLFKILRFKKTELQCDENSNPLWILGMYRSGTSLITRVIEELGFDIGPKSHLLQPIGRFKELNPKGFQENYVFAEYARFLLKVKDHSYWLSRKQIEGKLLLSNIDPESVFHYSLFNLQDDRISDFRKLSLFTYVNNYSLTGYSRRYFSNNWAVKVPQLTFFYEQLNKFWPKSKYLVVFRHPESTIKSTKKLTKSSGYPMYSKFYQPLVNDAKRYDFIFFSYDHFLIDPNYSVKVLCEKLNITIDDFSPFSKLIDNNLIRFNPGNIMDEGTKRLYNKMKNLSVNASLKS